MTPYVGYLLGGLGSGAVVASLALGLVLTCRTSGVVNFAHAAMGMYVAFSYYEFRDQGNLVLPIPGAPERIHLLRTPTQATAICFAIALAALLGLAVYWLVFRPLRQAPALARVVASLGLYLYLQEMVRLRFSTGGTAGARAITYFRVLSDFDVHLLGTTISANRLILAASAVLITVALTVTFRVTRFGLATRAAAGNEKGALLTGISPDRVGALNWMLATILGGFAVILIQPIAGLDPATTSLLVVPALAAALVGGLSSFAITTAAGFGIGMAQSLLAGWAARPDTNWLPEWLPVVGLQQLVPVGLVIAALVWRGDPLPTRSAVAEQRLPAAPAPRHPLAWAVGLAALASIGLLTFGPMDRQALIVSMVAAFLSLSVVVVTGYVGQISLATLALAGIAGFTVIDVAQHGLSFPLAAAVAVAVATLAGTLVGLPARRVRGMVLAVATIAVAVAIEALVLGNTWFSGGDAGRRAPRPSLFGIDVGLTAKGDANFRPQFGFVVLAVLVACSLGVANIRRNRTGLRWLAVRANERAAAAAGIDVGRAKVGAFAVSSALAGIAGVFLAYEQDTLSTNSFLVIGSLVVLSLTYLAGISSIGGALLAGLLAQAGLLTIELNARTDGVAGRYAFAVSGLAMIVTALTAPDGITGQVRSAWGRAARRFRRGAGSSAAAPSPVSVGAEA